MQQQDLEIFAPPQGTKSQHNVPFAQPDRGASALQEKLTGTKKVRVLHNVCQHAPSYLAYIHDRLGLSARKGSAAVATYFVWGEYARHLDESIVSRATCEA